jgi:hypothetical protein
LSWAQGEFETLAQCVKPELTGGKRQEMGSDSFGWMWQTSVVVSMAKMMATFHFWGDGSRT